MEGEFRCPGLNQQLIAPVCAVRRTRGIQPGDFTALLEAIASGDACINVHRANFPNGEIRGQVEVR